MRSVPIREPSPPLPAGEDGASAPGIPDNPPQAEPLRSRAPAVAEEKHIREVLEDLRTGKPPNADALEFVFDHLRRLARTFMGRRHAPPLLQTTALLNEAYLKLFDRTDPQWNDSAHFFHCASQVMRQIVVDHARHLSAKKRCPTGGFADVDPQLLAAHGGGDPLRDIVVIDDSLSKLAEHDADLGKIVQLHVFGGRTMKEVAELLGRSLRSTERDWRLARAWLCTELRRG